MTRKAGGSLPTPGTGEPLSAIGDALGMSTNSRNSPSITLHSGGDVLTRGPLKVRLVRRKP